MIRKLSLILIALASLAGLTAFGGDNADATKKADAKELKPQTHCPVMGGKIDSTVFTDIQGQRVYHCCPMCGPKLKADPDKYFKKAAADGVLFENIQTRCPVSGEELENKNVFVDYDGRRIYFCCSKCKASFNAKEAKKILKKLDEMMPARKAEPQEKHDEHDGHNHG